MMKTQNIHIKIDGLSIEGFIENPWEKKLMILAHGFTWSLDGPSGIFSKLSHSLQGHGYSVLRFNFRWTPGSGGKFQDMTVENEVQDFKNVIQYARSLGYKKIWLLWESMGGTISVLAYDPDIHILALWYTAFDFLDTDFKKLLTEPAKKILDENDYFPFHTFKIWRTFIEQIPTINIYKDLEKIHCPTLLVHGDWDSDVPFEQSEKAYKLLNSEKEIHILTWAWHCFRNEQEESIELTVEFLKKHF